jgi:hypothetical protein
MGERCCRAWKKQQTKVLKLVRRGAGQERSTVCKAKVMKLEVEGRKDKVRRPLKRRKETRTCLPEALACQASEASVFRVEITAIGPHEHSGLARPPPSGECAPRHCWDESPPAVLAALRCCCSTLLPPQLLRRVVPAHP